jgi:hypothetical protein
MDFIPCGNGILALSIQAANKNPKKMVSEKHWETLGMELGKHKKFHTRQRTTRNNTVSKWCLAHLVYL